MHERCRVLLLVPHLGGGGAERVFALLAGGLSREKYDLHLGLITEATAPQGLFPAGVSIHALGAARVRASAFRLLALFRRVRPQVILSGMYHLSFLVLLLRPFFPRGTRVAVRQNGAVSAALDSGGLPAYTRLLYRLLYRRADRVICQSPAMADDLAQQHGIAASRLIVLFNPVDVAGIRAATEEGASAWAGPGPHLLAVGRLSHEKGFDLLLCALASVRKVFPQADLVIAGSGREEALLKALCRNLGLESAVRFAGYIDRPDSYYAGATAFVLSSRHEGMPNALLEAAAAGLPLVALPAAGGLSDLLREQPGTWLAAEVSATALTASLLEALTVLKPGHRFVHKLIEPFRLEWAISAYEDLIDDLIEEGSV